MRILCIGDCGTDRYLPGDQVHVGGISANFALEARGRLGSQHTLQLVAPLGDDGDAVAVRQRFSGVDIECQFVTLPGTTPVQWIKVDALGERQFLRYEEGVLAEFRVTADSEIAQLVAHSEVLVTPVFEQNKAMFESIVALPRSGRTVVDFADFRQHPGLDFVAEVLPSIDIAFFGLQPEDRHSIDALKALAAKNGKLVVITLGESGALAFDGAAGYRCRAQEVRDVVDTTGAGDAFAAGFLCDYLDAANIDRALATGSAAGANAVQRFGAN
jgi:sugar/nucleoside kinase (ribokinase family)